MATTFEWAIERMTCQANLEDKSDVVNAVFYNCTGNDGTHSVTFNGVCPIEYKAGSFIQFDQLTQEQVMGWLIANGLDKASVESGVQREIDKRYIPPLVIKMPPWQAS